MNTFIKTFIICLIATLGFLFYKYVGNNSFSPNLNVKDNSQYTSKVKTPSETEPTTQTVEQKTDTNKEEKKEQQKEFYIISYFYNTNGELIKSKRKFSKKPSLSNIISILLKGPLISETKKGVYSEIPANVDLISVKKNDNKLVVNLSSNFANNSSFESIEHRIKQLSKTIHYYEPNSQVYLQINGKEVEYLGGDGVYVKQPLD